jgi:hypothetical protein
LVDQRQHDVEVVNHQVEHDADIRRAESVVARREPPR